MPEHDVIIVGARCGGAAAAVRFARSGHSVLVLDRGRRGSDTLSTHVLKASTVEQFHRLGLLDAVLATGAPPMRMFLTQFGGESYPRPVGGEHGFMLSVRRTALDPILIGAAERAGATFRFGARAEELIWEGERVVGVRGKSAGSEFSARARLVIGADGRHSLVARRVAARAYDVLPSPSAAFYAYFRGLRPNEGVVGEVAQFAEGPDCDVLCCPCDDGLYVVLLIVRPDEFERIGEIGMEAYQARLQTVPTLARRLAEARPAGRLFRVPAREIRGYFREPAGPGWALLGDAGYYAHPAAANGIHDALRSAELLHEHVVRAWHDGREAEAYLDRYQEIRDEENRPPFYASYRLGAVNPFRDPEMAAFVRASAGS